MGLNTKVGAERTGANDALDGFLGLPPRLLPMVIPPMEDENGAPPQKGALRTAHDRWPLFVVTSNVPIGMLN